MTSLRWGILGPGRIAPRLVRAIRSAGRASLAAVASRDADRATAFAVRHAIPTAFGSYDDLLQSPDVDVVYVALPNHLHAAWTARALEAGKHVLCEKPLALTVAEVDAVAIAAQRSGRVAVEAFMYLHHPQIRRALALAQGGDLGRVEIVNGSFSFTLIYPDDPRIDPAMGGGSLWDVGCYPVSFARRLAGEDHESLHAYARFDERGVDRTFAGQMRFPGGLIATFDSGFAAPDRQRLEIVGSDATLTLDAPFLTAPDGPDPSLSWSDGAIQRAIDVQAVDQYRLEVEDLTAVILDGTPPLVDLAFSRGTVGALVELDAAARAGSAGSAAAAGSAATAAGVRTGSAVA